MKTEDLVEIYYLFIRTCAEYCSVAFGSSLTLEQTNKISNIEKTCFRIILNEMYIGYLPACEMLGIQPITERRQHRMLSYAKKCINHPTNARFFPVNENVHSNPLIRKREPFQVNFARTEAYKKSTIPHCQRLLNVHFGEKEEGVGQREGGKRGE